jgi:hypothetical protein
MFVRKIVIREYGSKSFAGISLPKPILAKWTAKGFTHVKLVENGDALTVLPFGCE